MTILIVQVWLCNTCLITPPGDYVETSCYRVIDGENLRSGQTNVTVKEGLTAHGQTATVDIRVSPLLEKIEIIQQPNKRTYGVGESFDSTGMTVRAYWSDNTTTDVENYEVLNGSVLQPGQTFVTIRYVALNGEFTVNCPITVNVALSSITISEMPTQTKYYEGDNFNSEGMVVTAYYVDDSFRNVDDYEITDGTDLRKSRTSVTVRYTEGNVTVEKTVPITVSPKLTSITITTLPTKTDYNVGDNFDSTGMAVTAIYSDGSTKDNVTFEVVNGNNLQLGQGVVTIKYTDESRKCREGYRNNCICSGVDKH